MTLCPVTASSGKASEDTVRGRTGTGSVPCQRITLFDDVGDVKMKFNFFGSSAPTTLQSPQCILKRYQGLAAISSLVFTPEDVAASYRSRAGVCRRSPHSDPRCGVPVMLPLPPTVWQGRRMSFRLLEIRGYDLDSAELG